MSETENDYVPQLNALNIERVYRGQPAYVGRVMPGDALRPRELEVTSLAAEGLSYEEIAQSVGGLALSTVRTHLHSAYRTLGVDSKIGLVAYFPISQDDKMLDGKRLADLGERSAGLNILQGLSLGLHYKQVARQRLIADSTVRTHIHNICETWAGADNGVGALRIANGLRARYVHAIERHDYGAYEDIAQLTLPLLAEMEPDLLKTYRAG